MQETSLSPTVVLSTINQRQVLRVANEQACASIAIEGAHVFEFQPANQDNLLFVSRAESFETGEAIRGGIPVCWPWFGTHPSMPDAPSHGTARTQNWDYQITVDESDRTEIVFRFHQAQNEFVPTELKAELTVSIGKTLLMSLSTENVGESPIQISQALHTYFRVTDIAETQVQGFPPCRYLDKLSGQSHEIKGTVTIDQETDWVIQDQGQPMVITANNPSAVKMTRLGSRSVVLWNPWIEKSKTLSHFLPHEYQQMVCLEAGNVGEDARLLKPGQSHALIMELATA